MKKYFSMVLVAMFCFCLAGNAQERQGQRSQGPRMEPKEQAEAMAKELDLTEEQTAQVQKLFEEQAEKRKESRADSSESREDRRARFEKERQAFSEKLEKVIGKEKAEQWMKKMEERRQQRRQN